MRLTGQGVSTNNLVMPAYAYYYQAPLAFDVASIKAVKVTPDLYNINLGKARNGTVTLGTRR